MALESVTSDDERHELVNGLFREAHSLKGAANAVGLADIAEVCHRAEDLLATCRDQPAALDEKSVETLFGVVDSLRARADRLRAPPSTPAPAPVAASGITTAATPVVPNAAPAPAPSTTRPCGSPRRNSMCSCSTRASSSLRSRREPTARSWSARPGGSTKKSATSACCRFRLRAKDSSESCVIARRAKERNAACTSIGGAIELDRAILDGLRDPLQHLVRNAIIHGIESPERRAATASRSTAR